MLSSEEIKAQNRLSYRDLPPLERGGVNARRGFDYQDHVAVRYCLQMLTEETLLEVWCESLDDVTLVWLQDGREIFEFVQVKKLDHDQLWTPALLMKQDSESEDNNLENDTSANKGKSKIPKKSILEKSLANDRAEEECFFRLVTSIKPKKILQLFTTPRSYKGRKEASFLKLKTSLKEKLPEVKSQNGNDVEFWADRMLWEVHASSETLSFENIHILRQFGDQQSKSLQEDQWFEIYKRILQHVQEASMQPDEFNPITQRLNKSDFTQWLLSILNSTAFPNTLKLRQKLQNVNLEDRLGHAENLHIYYRQRALEGGYLNSTPRADIEAKARSVLNKLVLQLDVGNFEPGLEFFNKCLEELEKFSHEIPEYRFTWIPFLEGFMYHLTGRCDHRFGEPLK